jgi:hypothetical protein
MAVALRSKTAIARARAKRRNAGSGAVGTATQRRRARALWQGLSITEIAHQEGVTHSAVSQSISAPAIAEALRRVSKDCERRRGVHAEWRATRLPALLERFGLTEG